MNLIEKIQNSFISFLIESLEIEDSVARSCTLELNTDEQKQDFGDLNSSAALILSKQLKKSPRDIAQNIAHSFKDTSIEKIEIAGPGFLNFFLTQKAFDQLAQELFEQKTTFFKPEQLKKEKINIGFVSANPTGPLHFGHGRGGIIGDVLANVLKFLGHDVTKEFYINDAGAQIQKLGNSLKARYQIASGLDVNMPLDGYQGEYLRDIAEELFAEHGDRLLDQPTSFFGDYAKKRMLENIKKTLSDYGIHFDVWFSEKKLHDSGAIEKAIALLDARGHMFENEDAFWFRSTTFGDDKDRVVRKKDGSLTYAAADIAYMQDKAERGYDQLIYILGHDHHSYATRLNGLLQALGLRQTLDVILYQLVKLKEAGEQVKMSKRAGNIVDLQGIIDTVGPDVARFFYLNRKADAQLEFDLDLALTQSEENPVYYIQYAYVRTGSILEKAKEHKELDTIIAKDLDNLSEADDFILKKIVQLKSLLADIGINHQTHILAYYSHELAQVFNRYYNKNRVIELENIPLSRARLALIAIVREALSVCLELLGVSKPEKM